MVARIPEMVFLCIFLVDYSIIIGLGKGTINLPLNPFFLRLFGLGHLVLTTSDKNNKYVKLLAIKDTEKVKDLIRNHVEKSRKRTGTKEVDFE